MNTLSKLVTGILIFVCLFYNHIPGLNISLFAFAVWMFCFAENQSKPKSGFFWMLSAACMVAIFSFAWYGDEISFFALFFSIIVTVLYSQFPSLNVVTYPIILGINFLTFPFRIFFFRNWLPGNFFKSSWKKWIATAVVPILFLILFTFVYATGSDLFSGFFEKVFFKLDIVQIILLGILAFFILFNLWCLWLPRLVIRLNTELKDDFRDESKKSIIPSFSLFDKSLERRGGEITFILLNILLLIFIISYNYEQFFAVGANNSLSDEIHQRIATVIVSIILAIGLILFYFKSKINLGTEGRLLKMLSIIWIILNSLLVLSAFIKNGEYILHYGLTFKRISVFIFLIICLIGLYLTWYKIRFQKTNVFLINRMSWTLFFTLVITAPINFSSIVTTYNIHHIEQVDTKYLQGLPFNKAVLFDNYRNDPAWQDYFAREKEEILFEQNKPFLSSILYYKQLKLK